MTLSVETGSGSATADAFVSVAFCDTYHDNRGNAAWASLSNDEKEQAIRRATSFISEGYKWRGLKTNGRLQALAWPRGHVTDAEGFPVESDEVPIEVQRATAEVALVEAATPGSMSPTYTPNQRVKRITVGPITEETDVDGQTAHGERPVLTVVLDQIGKLIDRSAGSSISGMAVRV